MGPERAMRARVLALTLGHHAPEGDQRMIGGPRCRPTLEFACEIVNLWPARTDFSWRGRKIGLGGPRLRDLTLALTNKH